MATFEPPVQINPDVPDSQKWAFVNQNFLTLANQVGSTVTNSVFGIVQSGNASLAAYTTTDGNRVSGTVVVTHNLGYVPAVLAFNQGSSGQYLGIWDNGFILRAYSFAVGHVLNITGAEWHETIVTSTDITFKSTVVLSQNGGSFTTPTYNIRYYIMQVVAS